MNILGISNIFPPGYMGGYELGAYELCDEWAARGHAVSVLTSSYLLDDDKAIKRLSVERSLDCMSVRHERRYDERMHIEGTIANWRNIRRIGSAIRRFRPDVIVVFNAAGLGPVGMYHFLAALGLPVLSYYMDNVFGGIDFEARYWKEYVRIFGRLGLPALGKVICMSRNLATEMADMLPGLPETAVYVPGWAAKNSYPLPSSSSGSLSPEKKFVFCGRIAPHKGVDLIPSAVRAVVDRGYKIHVDVYGAGEVSKFLQDVSAQGLSEFITYRGSVSKAEMQTNYKSYDGLLFPTHRREPFGFVASEAAAAGCIPIMTHSIGAAEWFVDGVDCIKIDPSVESLSNAMLLVMNMEAADLDQMRRRTRSGATQRFAYDRWMPAIEATLQSAVDDFEGLPQDALKVEAAFLCLHELWNDTQ